MNIRLQRCGDYWRAVWFGSDGKERHKSLGPTVGVKRNTRKAKLTEAAAHRRCLELEKQMKLTPGVRDGLRAPTLAAWLDKYLELRTDLSPASRRDIESSHKHLLEYFEESKRIDEITRQDAAQFRAWLAAKTIGEGENSRPAIGDQTVRKHMRNCRTIFGRRSGAMKLDMIPFNPFDREQASVGRIDATWAYISTRTAERILDACPDDSWRVLFALYRWAGLRRGEALRLDWPDIDWQARTLTVRHEGQQTTKRRQRVVPMVPKLYELLLARFNSAAAGEKPVKEKNELTINRDFIAIVKRAEVDRWPKLFHTLRKNCETDWLAAYPVFDVCRWMGHDPAVAAAHYHQTKDHVMHEVTGLQAEAEQSEIQKLRTRLRRVIAIAKSRSATNSPRISPKPTPDPPR